MTIENSTTPRLCSAEGCDQPVSCRGCCKLHYDRLWRAGALPPKAKRVCSVDGCGRKHYAKEFCEGHYAKLYDDGRKCSIDGCGRSLHANGYCAVHYKRFVRYRGTENCAQMVEQPFRRGRGQGSYDEDGYIRIWIDGKTKPAHVRIAEAVLGKPLPKGAIVHHVNEIKSDNRNENLVICPDNAYHQLIHNRMRALAACGHADWRKCKYCHKHDDVRNLKTNGKHNYHRVCEREYLKLWKARRASKSQ